MRKAWRVLVGALEGAGLLVLFGLLFACSGALTPLAYAFHDWLNSWMYLTMIVVFGVVGLVCAIGWIAEKIQEWRQGPSRPWMP